MLTREGERFISDNILPRGRSTTTEGSRGGACILGGRAARLLLTQSTETKWRWWRLWCKNTSQPQAKKTEANNEANTRRKYPTTKYMGKEEIKIRRRSPCQLRIAFVWLSLKSYWSFYLITLYIGDSPRMTFNKTLEVFHENANWKPCCSKRLKIDDELWNKRVKVLNEFLSGLQHLWNEEIN